MHHIHFKDFPAGHDPGPALGHSGLLPQTINPRKNPVTLLLKLHVSVPETT